MIIYLIRHGETTGDIEDRYGGDYDDHLTENGQRQATQLADRLSGSGIESLFTSPRFRARETAAVIAEKLGLSAKEIDDLRECNRYGILTGMTKAEALKKYPDQVESLKDMRASAEGGEAYTAFRQRIINALDAITRESADKVAVVTHGGPIRVVFREVLDRGEIDVSDCGFAVLEAKNGNFRLVEQKGIIDREQL